MRTRISRVQRLATLSHLPFRAITLDDARQSVATFGLRVCCGLRLQESEQQRRDVAARLCLHRLEQPLPVAHRVLVPERERVRRVGRADDLDEDVLVGAAAQTGARSVQQPRLLRRQR
eukprot:6190933-Pleurochrysis_carterae.AAC.2